jgi:hypothetical protein
MSQRGHVLDQQAEHARAYRDECAMRECRPFSRCGLCRACEERSDLRRALEQREMAQD